MTREKVVELNIDESLTVQFVYHDSRIKRMINPNLMNKENQRYIFYSLQHVGKKMLCKNHEELGIHKTYRPTHSTTNLTDTPDIFDNLHEHEQP